MNKKTTLQILELIKKGKYNLAEKNVNKLINTQPEEYSYQNLLAIIYASQKKFQNSIKVLNKIIKFSPNFIDAYINLGSIYDDLNQLKKSANCFKKAIEINPNHLTAQFNLAGILDKLNKVSESNKIYKRLVDKEPNNVDLLTNYSSNLIKKENLVKAKKILNKILKLDPNNTKARINLGVVEKNKENFKKAAEYFSQVLKINPSLSEAYYNLGIIYEKSEELEKACASFSKAIKIKPFYAEAHYNLGCIFEKLGKKKSALLSYKSAIKYKKGYLKALFNLARVQLATNDFKNGWIGLEQRKGGINKVYNSVGVSLKQVWDGSKFEGPLVIHGEQGIGDEILYSSMFRDLMNYHSNLTVTSDQRLIPIMQRSFPNFNFVGRHEYDYINKNLLFGYKHIFAGSLGKIFRNSLKDFRLNKNPWLFCNSKKYEVYKNKLSHIKNIKVGLSWKTSGVKSKDRNIALFTLASLFPKQDFDIINLQYGNINSDNNLLEKNDARKLIYFDDLDYKNDLEDMAALIYNCDLVVTVGNAVAHLAGALGKHVWSLVPVDSQWWWHFNSNKSLWYPKVKIFRNNNRENWDYVFNLLKKEVKIKYYR